MSLPDTVYYAISPKPELLSLPKAANYFSQTELWHHFPDDIMRLDPADREEAIKVFFLISTCETFKWRFVEFILGERIYSSPEFFDKFWTVTRIDMAASHSRVKKLRFWGYTLDDLHAFPDAVRQEAGYQLDKIQNGLLPTDWEPMRCLPTGWKPGMAIVQEIRIGNNSGIFVRLYVTKFADTLHILHCYPSNKLRKCYQDISDIIEKRYADLTRELDQ